MKVAILILGFVAIVAARCPTPFASRNGFENAVQNVADKTGNALHDFGDKIKEDSKKIDNDIKKDIENAKKALKEAADKIKKAGKDIDEDLKKFYNKAKEAVIEIGNKIKNASDDVQDKIMNDIKCKLEILKKIIKFIQEKLEELKEDFEKNTTYSCNGTQCEFCRIIPGKYVSEDNNDTAKACIRMKYDVEQESIEIEGCVNDKCYFNHVFNINNAEPVCIHSSRFPVSSCLRLYAMDVQNDSVKMCLANEVNFQDVTLAAVNLNCIQLVQKQHVYLVVGEIPKNETSIFKFDGADLIPALKRDGRVQLF